MGIHIYICVEQAQCRQRNNCKRGGVYSYIQIHSMIAFHITEGGLCRYRMCRDIRYAITQMRDVKDRDIAAGARLSKVLDDRDEGQE